MRRCLELVALLLCSWNDAAGQTFVQVSNMSQHVGPRLTREVTRAQVSRDLLRAIGTFATFVEGGTAYEFVTDPMWGRVLYGQKDVYIREFTNDAAAPHFRLHTPLGLDVTARRTVFIADRGLAAVVIARFDPASQSMTRLAVLRSLAFEGAPVDVAWDGRVDPLNSEYFYVLSARRTISYWRWNGTSASLEWTLALPEGAGTGQLADPRGLCVGRTLGASGGTVFTTDLIVADAGNRRLVKFSRGSGGLSWQDARILPSNGMPTDCATDHFGNIYTTDQTNSKLVKYTSWLYYLTSYGAYGRGVTSMNTLSHPRALHHPMGIRVNSAGQSVVYSEGRLITAEDWGDSSGAVQHYLGMWGTIGAVDVGDPSASVSFVAMDNARVWADVWGSSQNAIVRVLVPQYSSYGSGPYTMYWNGRLENGTIAPDGYYQFRIGLVSNYTCPSGESWCWKTLYSASFWHRFCQEGSGSGGGGEIPIIASDPVVALAAARHRDDPDADRPRNREPQPPNRAQLQPPTCEDGPNIMASPLGVPTVFAVRQLPAAPPTLAAGLTALSSVADVRPSLSMSGTAVDADLSSATALRTLVREHGISTLQVNLSENTDVVIDVYELNGRRVRRLEYRNQPPGMYAMRWDGTRSDGRRAHPGVYMVVVSAQGQTSTHRLVLTASR